MRQIDEEVIDHVMMGTQVRTFNLIPAERHSSLGSNAQMLMRDEELAKLTSETVEQMRQQEIRKRKGRKRQVSNRLSTLVM